MKTLLVWAKLHKHMIRIIGDIYERVEAIEKLLTAIGDVDVLNRLAALEAAVLAGGSIYTILVPDGTSAEVSWEHSKAGRPFTRGRKVLVIADREGRFKKVVPDGRNYA